MDIQSYVAQLNSNAEWTRRSYESVPIDARFEFLAGIKAVFFDVYGTLIDCYRLEFADPNKKQRHVMSCFEKVIDEFNLANAFFDVQPQEKPAKTLRDFYHGLIMVQHQKSTDNGIDYPEVRIEQVWKTIIQICGRHGYEVPQPGWESLDEMAFGMAYYYHFLVLGRRLYPGVYDLLKGLKNKDIQLGIISNAQFYTIFDLSWLIFAQSRRRAASIRIFFPEDNCFFSYQYGVSKPNTLLFSEALKRLHSYKIEPHQVLYVGNDMLNDVYGAKQCGMRTALFVGDKDSLGLGQDSEEVGGLAPDLVLEQLAELLCKLS